MSIEEQGGEPVEVDAEVTAELEMLPDSALDVTDSHQVVRPIFPPVGVDCSDADKKADHGDRPDPDGKSKLGQVADALQCLRGELSDVRTLTEKLEAEVGSNENIINALANEVESTRMKQTNTEELLGLCLSEIEKLKSQMIEAQDEPAVSKSARAPATNGSMRAAPETPVNDADDEPRVSSADGAPAAGNSMRALVVRNCSTTKSYPLDSGTVSLGSSPDNDIRLGSSYVSRHHAKFVNSGTDCVLKDLDSTNGTYVNSRRVKRYVLRNGDWIAIGKHRFEFVEHDSMKRDS
ncbi:MAG: FHA domain-containing protein [Woeseia sp.]|nr:FHA domain-containing protein [Woeseia sp.]